MPKTIHAFNWKSTTPKTVCNIPIGNRLMATNPIDVTCSICTLRVVREGQKCGLDIHKVDEWSWEDLQFPQ